MRRGLFGLVLVTAALAAGCNQADDVFCAKAGCGWSDQEWTALVALSGLPAQAPDDPSNKYLGNADARALGLKFFFDTRWSGLSTQVDVLKRPVPYARTPKGQPSNLACVSCHDLRRGSVDTISLPGNVSIGAAWADTNALPVINSAFYDFPFWNGRADSVWAQAVGVVEGTNMNGTRLNTLWMMSEHYRTDYAAVFPDDALPAMGAMSDVQALVDATGQCKLSGTTCPTGCRSVTSSDGAGTGCFPRFPLAGKPGAKAGCQPGDPTEPSGDAFDCMDPADQDVATRTLVNYGKAVAAYQAQLISRDSAFDRYVAGVKAGTPRDTTAFSDAAERGARLFIGKAACVDCHNTNLLSDKKFHNVGIDQVGPGVPTEGECPAGAVCDCVSTPEGADHAGLNCLPWGALDGFDKLAKSKFRRESRWSDDTSMSDQSKIVATLTATPTLVARLKGSYRTPSLRDVAITGPYMHNGSLPTLESVIEHYNQGGSATAPGARSAQIKPLYLTDDEKSDLIEFLKTLTGAPLADELVTPPVLP